MNSQINEYVEEMVEAWIEGGGSEEVTFKDFEDWIRYLDTGTYGVADEDDFGAGEGWNDRDRFPNFKNYYGSPKFYFPYFEKRVKAHF